MRKLGKSINQVKETVEAYACNCTCVLCECTSSCGPSISAQYYANNWTYNHADTTYASHNTPNL